MKRKKKTTDEVAVILQALQKKLRKKILKPEDVVNAARPASSPLHKYFVWDDTRAAKLWRLHQARNLICRVYITNPEDLGGKCTPVYVSLVGDRSIGGGGYRRVSDVVNSKHLRQQLLETARMELVAWIDRYQALTELVVPVAKAAGLNKELNRLKGKL